VVLLSEWEGRNLMPITGGTSDEEAARKGGDVLERIHHPGGPGAEHGDALPEPATCEAVSAWTG
jgi:hypothetical protein